MLRQRGVIAATLCDPRRVPFSSPPEIETLAALSVALEPLGYRISQQARVIDATRAAAENPRATAVRGPTLLDQLIPEMRQAAGPFGRSHRWLEPDDWRYAFSSHFDFVVQEGLQSEHPTHPLFAVEFDGSWEHADPEVQRRDEQKNRLCLASGLPLVRLDEASLHRRERFSVIEWLARLWHAYRAEMPDLMAKRDAAASELTDDEIADAGLFLLGERPHLDVELTFQITHPFPPAHRAADRLARQYGFQWSEVDAIAPDPARPRWKVDRWMPPCPSLSSGLIDRWTCELTLNGPDSQHKEVRGLADVRKGYPLHSGPPGDSQDCLLAGQIPYLPAGPWTTAPNVLGYALSIHNTLVEVGRYLRRHDRPE